MSCQKVEGFVEDMSEAEGAADGQFLLHYEIDRQFDRATLHAELHDSALGFAMLVGVLQAMFKITSTIGK